MLIHDICHCVMQCFQPHGAPICKQRVGANSKASRKYNLWPIQTNQNIPHYVPDIQRRTEQDYYVIPRHSAIIDIQAGTNWMGTYNGRKYLQMIVRRTDVLLDWHRLNQDQDIMYYIIGRQTPVRNSQNMDGHKFHITYHWRGWTLREGVMGGQPRYY